MKAVLCRAFGPPESLSFEEVDAPIVGPDDVLVDVRAAALNFPDVLMIEGKYQSRPPFPFSPGGEFAGVVAQVGAAVTGLTPGHAGIRRLGTRRFRGADCGAGEGTAAHPADDDLRAGRGDQHDVRHVVPRAETACTTAER